MRNLLVTCLTILPFLFSLVFFNELDANEIYGCYHKVHGQLRVVGGHDECLFLEAPILLSGTDGGQPTPKTLVLACVSGFISPSDSGENIYIDSQKNINISDPSDVFIVELNNPEEVGKWGLVCRDDWVLTGCTPSINGTIIAFPFDMDISAKHSGCWIDDDELAYIEVSTTCCKIVEKIE